MGKEMQREHVPNLEELRQTGYQVVDTRIGDSEQVIRFATRNQNIDLTNGEEIRRNAGQMKAFEVDSNGRAVRELSQTEMRSALGLPTSFAQEAAQEARQTALQNYSNGINSALNEGNLSLAIERGTVLYINEFYHGNQVLAQQMAAEFERIFGFNAREVPVGPGTGDPTTKVATFLRNGVLEDGSSIRQAILPRLNEEQRQAVLRQSGVSEEPRVAVAAPTEDQREADMGLFVGGLNSYRSNAPGVTDESRQFALAQSVRAYDTIKGYAPEQATELEGMFKKRTGLGIEEARQQI